jgi:hypothetical protein
LIFTHGWNNVLNDETFDMVMHSCPNLEKVRLYYCTNISFECLTRNILQHIDRLSLVKHHLFGLQQNLSIDHSIAIRICWYSSYVSELNDAVTGDACLQLLLESLTNITSIDLPTTIITNTVMEIIASHCPALRTLSIENDFEDDNEVGEQQFVRLFQQCTLLTKFHLNNNSKFADEAAESLAIYCVDINEISFMQSKCLSEGTLDHIAAHCDNLTVLSVIENSMITLRGFDNMLSHCGKLHTIVWESPLSNDQWISSIATHCGETFTSLTVRCSKIAGWTLWELESALN